MGKKVKRFVTAYKQSGINQVKVLIDTETGVNYLYVSNGYAGGLTVLLDAEGNPVITKETPTETDASDAPREAAEQA